MTVFITGDRKLASPYPPMVAIEIMRALGAGEQVATGTQEFGVEQIVRDFADQAGFPLQVWAGLQDATYESKAQLLLTDSDQPLVVAIHVVPQESKWIAALAHAFADNERLVLRTPVDLLLG